MRWLVTFLAWLASLAALAPLCFFGALVLAGPHGGLLPSFLQAPVIALAWGILLLAPVLVARVAWRRVNRPRSESAV